MLCIVSGDITGVSVTGVSVTGVSITGVSITGVSVTGVSITGVSITGVSITGVSPRDRLEPGSAPHAEVKRYAPLPTARTTVPSDSDTTSTPGADAAGPPPSRTSEADTAGIAT